jgi:hypothetical protein
LTDPIAEYGHSGGWPSVTRGFVYRGNRYAALFGRYFFADYRRDNVVNGLDLQAFAEDYGHSDCSEDCAGDFKNDGDVDGRNLWVVINDYGREDCP